MPHAALRRLFEPDVALSVLTDFSAADPLHEREAAHVQRAVDKRQREYAAGRTCARRALAALGLAEAPSLPSLADRRVAWPMGYLGSITHAQGVAAAVVTHAARVHGVGVDAEQRERVEPALYEQIARDEEIAWIVAGGAEESLRATALFSGKEAFYKAQYSISETFLGFRDVIYRPREDGFEIELCREVPELARLGARFVGRVAWTAHHVFTGVTIRR